MELNGLEPTTSWPRPEGLGSESRGSPTFGVPPDALCSPATSHVPRFADPAAGERELAEQWCHVEARPIAAWSGLQGWNAKTHSSGGVSAGGLEVRARLQKQTVDGGKLLQGQQIVQSWVAARRKLLETSLYAHLYARSVQLLKPSQPIREWAGRTVLKTVGRASAPWVRIPPPPLSIAPKTAWLSHICGSPKRALSGMSLHEMQRPRVEARIRQSHGRSRETYSKKPSGKSVLPRRSTNRGLT